MPEPRFSEEFFQESADYILKRTSLKPKIAIILGSCLGDIAAFIDKPQFIDYKDIPNFLISSVRSHAGKLILGKLTGRDIICLSGRFHYYEGYDFEELVIPVRVLKLLGVETLILTNAAGAINTGFVPGDIMMISDHIKFSGASPLRGPNLDSFGPRFFDVSDMYTKALRERAKEAAQRIGVPLKEGIYFFLPGPQFESPAEIKASRILGADAVGMSTVTEALTAAHCGMKVLAFSLITNMAAGIEDPVTAEDVGKTAKASAGALQRLIFEVIRTGI